MTPMRGPGWVLIASCGTAAGELPDARIAGAPDATPLSRCFADDFDDAVLDGWTAVADSAVADATAGPDASGAMRFPSLGASQQMIAPALLGLDVFALRFDYNLYNSVGEGDVGVYLVPPGWTNPEDLTSRYDIAMHGLVSDEPADFIRRWDVDVPVELATHAPAISEGAWHAFALTRDARGALRLEIDGAPYLSSAADLTYPAPLDAVIRIYQDGAIDNVVLECVR